MATCNHNHKIFIVQATNTQSSIHIITNTRMKEPGSNNKVRTVGTHCSVTSVTQFQTFSSKLTLRASPMAMAIYIMVG